MTPGKIIPIAIFSAFLAACGSSSGGGDNVRPTPPPSNAPPPSKEPAPSSPAPGSSLGDVPADIQEIVREGKSISLNYTDESGDTMQWTIDGKSEGKFDFSALPNGVSSLPFSLTYSETNGEPQRASATSVPTPAATAAATAVYTATGTLHLYQQPYSIVIGQTWATDTSGNLEPRDMNTTFYDITRGYNTPSTALQSLINKREIFEYQGVAFNGKERGTFNYTVSFGDRSGYGSITGFIGTGKITLWPTQLRSDWIMSGEALIEKVPSSKNAAYELEFFGPNAEEIAGGVYDPRGNDEKVNEKGEEIDTWGNEVLFGGRVYRTLTSGPIN